MNDLIKLIEDFTKDKSVSDGGWPKVGDGDIKSLSEIIDKIISLKYESDPDGDMVIQYAICDRNKHRLISQLIPNNVDETNLSQCTSAISYLSDRIQNISTQINTHLYYNSVADSKKEKMKTIIHTESFDKVLELVSDKSINVSDIAEYQPILRKRFMKNMDEMMKNLIEEIDKVEYDHDSNFSKVAAIWSPYFKLFGDNKSKLYEEYRAKRHALYNKSREYRKLNKRCL